MMDSQDGSPWECSIGHSGESSGYPGGGFPCFPGGGPHSGCHPVPTCTPGSPGGGPPRLPSLLGGGPSDPTSGGPSGPPGQPDTLLVVPQTFQSTWWRAIKSSWITLWWSPWVSGWLGPCVPYGPPELPELSFMQSNVSALDQSIVCMNRCIMQLLTVHCATNQYTIVCPSTANPCYSKSWYRWLKIVSWSNLTKKFQTYIHQYSGVQWHKERRLLWMD